MLNKQQVVIITGMHRSGTSLIANLLQKAGVNIGNNLVGSHKGNLRGHFEDVDFLQFHEKVLHRFEQNHLVQTVIPLGELTDTDTKEALNLIEQRSEDALWGWKDPRTSLFLDFWHKLLPEACYVFVYRHPLEVVLSLLRRGIDLDVEVLTDPSVGLRVWHVYNQSILDFYRQHQNICLLSHIAGIALDVETFIDLTTKKLALPLQKSDIQALYHSTELSQMAISAKATDLLRQMAPEVVELYEQLETQADLPSPPQIDIQPTDQLTKLRRVVSSLSKDRSQKEQIPPYFPVLLAALEPETVLVGKKALDQIRLDYIAHLENHSANLAQQAASQAETIQDQLDYIRQLETRLNTIERTKVWRLARKWYAFKQSLSKVVKHFYGRDNGVRGDGIILSFPPNSQSEIGADIQADEKAGPTVKASVCIPAYNGAKYLSEAISSVLEQTLADIELVIVDDCSTDNTEAVIRSFSDNRIKYFKNPDRLGLVGNWNRCLELAKGPYICIFHQDDVMVPNNLAEKIKILEENPNVGLVHSNVLQIDPEGKLIREGWVVNPPPDHIGVRPGLKFFKTLLLGPNFVSCPSVVTRKVCYERLEGFDARLPFTADWEMWLRLALFYDIGYLPQPLIKYRWHENNETLNFLGVKDLEHAHRAKILVLEKYTGFIANAEELKLNVIKMHQQQAIDHILHHYRRQEYDQAKQYLAFAAEIYDDEARTSPEDYRDWLLQIVDQIWQPGSVATSQPQPSPETEEAKQSLWDPLIHQRIMNSLSGEDIAQEIPIRKLVKAAGFKIGTKPGFKWLYRYLQNNAERKIIS